MGLKNLFHVNGKFNSCDVGTSPEVITADSVKPGSIWISGHEWMKGSIEKKKSFREGIAYDLFDESDQSVFGILQVGKTDHEKMSEILLSSNYIVNPLKRCFKSTLRITALCLFAYAKFKRLLFRKKIEKGEIEVSELKSLDFPPPQYTVFLLKANSSLFSLGSKCRQP